MYWIVELLYRTSETNITHYVNYTLVQNKYKYRSHLQLTLTNVQNAPHCLLPSSA